jgi:serine/threonine protein kinase
MDLASPAALALERLLGSTIDGKYRVERLLGRGGMGAVFRALHLGTDRTVALKVIVPDFADRADFQARFEREARACGRLRHPNIVDVTDFGYAEIDGRRIAYLVMEYLDGCSLAEVVREGTALPLAWIVDVLEQAGGALEEAHRAGILHRDLKPDNVWLEPNRRGGYTVKVLDFGLAKVGGLEHAEDAPVSLATPPSPASGDTPSDSEGATLLRPRAMPVANLSAGADGETRVRPGGMPSRETTERGTEIGTIIGTPAYMSPEQCRGEALTPRSDVYSLGVITYLMLTGRLPFRGSPPELLTAHMEEVPLPVRDLRPSLSPDAAEIVMRALAKMPDERPQSAGAFASMFAARAQTTADFLKSSLLVFLEHVQAFVSASIIGLSPVLALGLFAALNALAFVYGHPLVTRRAGPGFVVGIIMITVGPGMLLVQGAVVPAVMQALVAPLQPIDVGSLRRRFRPRLTAYLRSVAPLLALFVATAAWQLPARPLARGLASLARSESVATAAFAALGIALLPNLPLLVLFAWLARSGSARAFQFLAPTAVVEGLGPNETLRRATLLASSSPATLRAVRLVSLAATLGAGFVGGVGFAVLSRRLPPEAALGVMGIPITLAFVLVAPLLAVTSALTYLRARRALGEPLDRALEEFERAVLPESHWRLGERERVATLIASRR